MKHLKEKQFMKQFISLIFLCAIISISVQAQAVVKEKTLYERLGGAEGIALIVDDVVEAHMNNPIIQERFLPYKDQPEHLSEIKKHTRHFFGAGSGGPEQYTGRDMPTAHQGMKITAEEYLAVVDDILMVLDKHNKDEQTKKDVLAIVYSLKGQIINK